MARGVSKSVRNVALGVLAAGLFAIPMVPRANADLWNQQTTFTFKEPVEIPGRVLGPGTYVFQVANLVGNRNVIEVFNQDQTQLLATEFTVPAIRREPAGKTILTFEERAKNAPEAIWKWYYPGMSYGHEFLYNR